MDYQLKKVIDGFFISADSVDPLDYKDQDELNRETKRLDIIERAIDKFIFDYGIEKSEDIIDTEKIIIVRMFVLSKGMTEEFIMINSDGQIVLYNDDIPREILGGIGNIINGIVGSWISSIPE